MRAAKADDTLASLELGETAQLVLEALPASGVWETYNPNALSLIVTRWLPGATEASRDPAVSGWVVVAGEKVRRTRDGGGGVALAQHAAQQQQQ